MKAKFLIIWLCLLNAVTATGQQMHVEGFCKLKHSQAAKGQTALLELLTSEKDFTFFLGKAPIEAEASDESLRLSLPDKTGFLTIKHPRYGYLTWKVPGKPLRKKSHYQAHLITESIEKEYKVTKQWAVLDIAPSHAIVYLDSTMHTIEDGNLSLYLPVGKHSCRILSPFYQEVCDTLEITDSLRLEKSYRLTPDYAYLTVSVPDPEAAILLDQKEIGRGSAGSSRISPGTYRLTIKKDGRVCYDSRIEVANAEKKVITLTGADLDSFKTKESSAADASVSRRETEGSVSVSTAQQVCTQQVSIKAFDARTEIWINREKMAEGSWQGRLAPGFYCISSIKDGIESKTRYFWVEEGKDIEMDLGSPLADYGVLNVSCNISGASVFIDDVNVDITPCVISGLPADRGYVLTVIKGKKKAVRTVRLKANDIMNINIRL